MWAALTFLWPQASAESWAMSTSAYWQSHLMNAHDTRNLPTTRVPVNVGGFASPRVVSRQLSTATATSSAIDLHHHFPGIHGHCVHPILKNIRHTIGKKI